MYQNANMAGFRRAGHIYVQDRELYYDRKLNFLKKNFLQQLLTGMLS